MTPRELAKQLEALALGPFSTNKEAELLQKAAASLRRVEALEGALEPFADCCDQIADSEDDEEWAKFRLLVKDYRHARAALKGGSDEG